MGAQGIGLLMGVAFAAGAVAALASPVEPGPRHLGLPQCLTGPRLLSLGEEMTFSLFLPAGVEPGRLTVFPRHLERSARRARGFKADGDLGWLDTLRGEVLHPVFADGRASLSYRPARPGSYLARWEVGGETLYRYFAVVTAHHTVIRYTTGGDWRPNWHATGIPIEYRLAAGEMGTEPFSQGGIPPGSSPSGEKGSVPISPELALLQDYQRRFGDGVVPLFPDTPELSVEERAASYGKGLDALRDLLPDPGDARAVQVAMMHDLDPGYSRSLMSLGVADQGGMWESNGLPWLGMPEFPYFASPLDMRKPNPSAGGSLVAHQWDFCGAFHFLGPPPWHYQVSEGDWDQTERCLRESLAEARNCAEMSGHPAVLMPLFGGAQSEPIIYPPSHFEEAWDTERMVRYLQRYVGWMAFIAPSEYDVVYARSLDIADYYRRHFDATPRTIFVSRTDHLDYDFWWLAGYAGDRYLSTTSRIPWETNVPGVEAMRNLRKYVYKDPLSCEYIHIEDQHRQMRFERECPTPVWWFDYTRQEEEVGDGGSSIHFTPTPRVRVVRTPWERRGGDLVLRLRMETEALFPGYAIAVWGLPAGFAGDPDPRRVRTSADDFLVVRNTADEYHLVLMFDLAPDTAIEITLRGCAS